MRFTDAFTDRTGGQKKIKKGEYLPAGTLPVVDQGQEPIGGYTDDPDARCNAPLPCLLFGDHTKVIKYCNFPFALGADGVKVLEPRSDIDTRFAFHYLSVLPLPTDAGYSRHFKFLKRAWFPLPPLPEQQRIAAILDKADAIRRKRQQTLELADQFLRSAFLDMFGDPVTNPKDWEIVPLEQVCTRITDGTHQPPDWSEHGLPFLFVSNIVNGRITFQTKKHISEETWKELTRRCPIEVNDILYTTVGSYGNAALVETKQRFAFQRHIAHIKPDGERVHPEFLVGMLQSRVVRRQADHAVRGIAQKTLNLGDLKKFRVFLPPRDEQKRFVRLRCSALEQRDLAESAVASADNLLDSLVQRAFRGELSDVG
jgi:type I restriction enzyme S subunit